MAQKKIHRKLGRDRKYESLVHVIKYDDPPKADWKTDNERNFLDALNKHEERARETLRAAQLPTNFMGPYQRDDGSLCNLNGLVEGRDLEPEWWAARILEAAHATRRFIKEGNAVQAALWAASLQRSVDCVYVRSIEYDAQVGKETRRQIRYSDRDKQGWEQMADNLRRKDPNWKVKPMAREIEKQTGHKFSSVHPHIMKYLKTK